MKYYTIVYPDMTESGQEYDHWETLSEKEILNQYWVYWFTKMIQAKRPDFELTSENCINDWCIVHWAQRNYWREMKECIA
jgi:hypothetical protein